MYDELRDNNEILKQENAKAQQAMHRELGTMGQFQTALKLEIEEMAGTQRKQHLHMVQITKLHTTSINALEDGVSYAKKQIKLTYDAQSQIVDYLQ